MGYPKNGLKYYRSRIKTSTLAKFSFLFVTFDHNSLFDEWSLFLRYMLYQVSGQWCIECLLTDFSRSKLLDGCKTGKADKNGICFTFCPLCSMINQNRSSFYKINTLKNVNFSPYVRYIIFNQENDSQSESTTGSLAWKNSRHLATLPLDSPPNDVWETDLGSTSNWSCRVGNLIKLIRSTTQIWVVTIVGDPEAVSRAGRKGATKVFKHGRKSPWVPTLTGPFPNGQANAGSWLGTKNALYYCAQSANSFSWVIFVSS